MSQMSVEFSFDLEKMKQKGESKADVYYTLKKNFAKWGINCTTDTDEMLIFSGTGKESDYGAIWGLIMLCIDCDWITDYLTRFVFIEDNVVSDILAEIPRAKEIEAYGIGGISAAYA